MMGQTVTLKQFIESKHIDHVSFAKVFEQACSRIDDALESKTPKVSWFIGPSRAGKSHMIKRLMLRYPEQIINGRRNVPVLAFKVLSSTSTKSLPESVLQALKVPHQTSSVSAKSLVRKMFTQLKLADTRVLMSDESHHVVEPGSRVIPYSAADWFKDNDDDADGFVLSQILFGIPRLQKLLDASNQLRMRSYKPIVWMPYNPANEEDLKAFAAMVNTYMKLFVEQGWSFTIPLNVVVPNCYLHAAGLGGKLRDFMVELAGQVQRKEQRTIGMEDFRAVASALESAGHPNYPAFEKELVTPIELNQAYQHVLVVNEMN